MAQEKVVRDRRKFGRYPFQRPVSLCLCDMGGREFWRLGWIRNAGAGGMKIRLNGQLSLRRHQEVLVVVQGAGDTVLNPPGEEIRGRIAWIDDNANCFGLRYT